MTWISRACRQNPFNLYRKSIFPASAPHYDASLAPRSAEQLAPHNRKYWYSTDIAGDQALKGVRDKSGWTQLVARPANVTWAS